MAELKGARVFQSLLHARPAYPRGLFRRAATMPMRLKAHRVMIAKLLEGAELGGPVEKSLIDGPSALLPSQGLTQTESA